MKHAKTATASGRPIKVALLEDIDLLFCGPYFLVSLLMLMAQLLFRGLVSSVVKAVNFGVIRLNLNLFWLVVFNPLLLAVGYGSASLRPFSNADYIASVIVFALTATIYLKMFSPISPTIDARMASTFSAREQRFLMGVTGSSEEGSGAPKAIDFSQETILGSTYRTILIVPYIVLALLAPFSAFGVSLALCVVMYWMQNDFEHVEHVASHSKGGVLIGPGPCPKSIRLVEAVRKYVVWPFFGWAPDGYFVTHTLHHHVENNGPADWQSTYRYHRYSFLDFVKMTCWLGINFAVNFDSYHYLLSQGKRKIAAKLLRGHMVQLLVFSIALYLNPALAAVLASLILLGGISVYFFGFRWHGLHLPMTTTPVETSNNHLRHFVHHLKPKLHLNDVETARSVAEQVLEAPKTEEFRLFLLREEFSGGWGMYLLQALLWRRDFSAAGRCVVQIDRQTSYGLDEENTDTIVPKVEPSAQSVAPQVMHALASGCGLVQRGQTMLRVDRWVSQVAGDFLMRIARARIPGLDNLGLDVAK